MVVKQERHRALYEGPGTRYEEPSTILRHASWDGPVARVCLHNLQTNYCASQRDCSSRIIGSLVYMG